MPLPFQLLSTDFDGTFYAEFENPPVPDALAALIARLQTRGVHWVINTGRDLSGLLEAMARARLTIQPQFVVVVEREIYRLDGARYVSVEPWNEDCRCAQAELFARVRPDVPELMAWVNARFTATLYEDAYSPFCLIAGNNDDADEIMAYLEAYCQRVPQLTLVRNDVYARFSHAAYNKGTALSEIAHRLGVPSDQMLAAGDHYNDLPMLSNRRARWLLAPANAVALVQETVRNQLGYVSPLPCGDGLLDGLLSILKNTGLRPEAVHLEDSAKETR